MKETALNFGQGGSLVGILTRPEEVQHGDLAVIFINAGILHRVGPNRIHVRLARRLADRGVTSLRMDLPGVGDSGMLGTGLSLAEEGRQGIQAAMDLLQRQEVASRFVVFGLCSGADAAFQIACLEPRVVGIALVDPTRLFATWRSWARKILRGAVRPGAWLRLFTGRHHVLRRLQRKLGMRPEVQGSDAEPAPAGPPAAGDRGGATALSGEDIQELAREALRGLVERDVQILHVVTGDQSHLYNYRDQFLDAFPDIGLERVARLELFPRASHTFFRESQRIELEEAMSGWMASERFPRPTGSSDEIIEI